jgi:uncharacterized protein YndB with AHSA1/START domain
MHAKPETACFVIADISGYTSYLAGVELDHAHDIIADLMDTVVRGLRPPFRLAKFEGDAVFVYAVTEKIDGSLIQDAIESAYFGFRKRLRNIKQSTTCECNACRRMGTLDLKFVTHHGEFIKHKMGGRQELAGRDVILVHRLLKNAVNDRLGGHAYALYSEPCIQSMGIDPLEHGMVRHDETIDILGKVRCWVRDLEAAWQDEAERTQVLVLREDAVAILEVDVNAPRPTAWEYYIHPEHRPKWQGAERVDEKHDSGRRGVGTVNHCVHGKEATVEEILDWRPFDYYTERSTLPLPGGPKVLFTSMFTERPEGGTHVEIRVGKVPGREKDASEDLVVGLRQVLTGMMETYRSILNQQMGTPAAVGEPPMPLSSERFLTNPVHAH